MTTNTLPLLKTEQKDAIRDALRSGDVPSALLIALQDDQAFREECSQLVPAESRMLADALKVYNEAAPKIHLLVQEEREEEADAIRCEANRKLVDLYFKPYTNFSDTTGAIPEAVMRDLLSRAIQAHQDRWRHDWLADTLYVDQEGNLRVHE